MAWNLEVHTIDVAQGESSLLIAYTDDLTQYKSMLIDGGLQRYGSIVHAYLDRHLRRDNLDFLVTTHYDKDHSAGHITMLMADNMSNVTNVIATGVGDSMVEQFDRQLSDLQLATVGGGAFGAIIAGAYNNGAKYLSKAVTAVLQAWPMESSKPRTRDDATMWGLKKSLKYMERINNDDRAASLMKNRPTGATARAAKACVRAAFNIGLNDFNVNALLAEAIFAYFAPDKTQAFVNEGDDGEEEDQPAKPAQNRNWGFYTNQRYLKTTVYNNGRPAGIPTNNNLDAYFGAVAGKIKVGDFDAIAPDLNISPDKGRKTLVPALGAELLKIADPLAPKVYCVARLGQILNGGEAGGDPLNRISIGLAVVFNQFVYYTGGDLTVSGLDEIPGAIINNPTMGRPRLIPVYKSGHHGSSESNSIDYLKNTDTRSAFISSGSTSFKGVVLPTQEVIDMYTDCATMERFFLTNCKIKRKNVPASLGQRQLDDTNKARISGDNHFDPGEEEPVDQLILPKQNRGDILLQVSQAESQSTTNPPTVIDDDQVHRQFRVTYWEEDPLVAGSGLGPAGTRTETICY